MTESRGDRITTDERERALRELSAHFVAGRLGLVEYDERSNLAATVTSKAELAELFTDLPGQVPTVHEPATRNPLRINGFLVAGGAVCLIMIALVAGSWWTLLLVAGAAIGTASVLSGKSRRSKRRS